MRTRISAGGLTRRALLRTGAASAAVAALLIEAAGAAEDSPQNPVQSLDKVEPQKFDWGWIRWLMNAQIDPNAEMTLGVVQIEPNQSNPLHIHPNSAEYLHVLAGSCEHRLGDRWFTMKAGDTLRIPKNVPHMARTKGDACRSLIVYDTGKRQMVPVETK